MGTWYYDHGACVGKVYRHLNTKCTEAEYERQVVQDRITDAFGYNKNTKTYYLCEVKVVWSDLQKSVYQIFDTAFRFRKNRKGDRVIPVLAFPIQLQKELLKFDNWNSLSEVCRRLEIEIWLIDSSEVREVQRSKPGSARISKTKRPIAKTKVASAKKISSSAKATKAKTTKRPASKTSR